MKKNKIIDKPKTTIGDVAHTTGKIALSLIPGVGSAAAEIFSSIITPPLSKREDEWIMSIIAALQKVEKKVDGFKISDLLENEKFITTLVNASHVTIRNHQQEKIDALRNSV